MFRFPTCHCRFGLRCKQIKMLNIYHSTCFLSCRITSPSRRSMRDICHTQLGVSQSSVSARLNAQLLNVWQTRSWCTVATTARNWWQSVSSSTHSRSSTCWPVKIHSKWVLKSESWVVKCENWHVNSTFILDLGLRHHQLWPTWRFHPYWTCRYSPSSSCRRFAFETSQPSHLVALHWCTRSCIP